jgi:hypothetical protein
MFAVSWLAAVPVALCWESLMCTLVVPLLAKWRRWPVSRSDKNVKEEVRRNTANRFCNPGFNLM